MASEEPERPRPLKGNLPKHICLGMAVVAFVMAGVVIVSMMRGDLPVFAGAMVQGILGFVSVMMWMAMKQP